MSLFELRGKLNPQQSLLLSISGFLILIGVWWLLSAAFATTNIRCNPHSTNIEDRRYCENDSLRSAEYDKLVGMSGADLARFGLEKTSVNPILPSPPQVFKAFGTLFSAPVDAKNPNDGRSYLVYHTGYSLWLNLLGYLLAIAISIPIGFLLGLVPLFRGLFGKVFDAMRFVPLAAATGIFIAWFGFGTNMKVTFLAFGIMVYLVPVIVQRIDEVQNIYTTTVFTLGATRWQTIRTVYIPSVMSRLFDDIRVLTAISWTYITVAEMLNNEGGIGSMIFFARRFGNIDQTFALLLLIVLIGIIQDRLFVLLDRWAFPYKHIKS